MRKAKSNSHIYDAMTQSDYAEELVSNVQEDFKARQTQRKSLEAQWQLNMNFMLGNQYCAVGRNGDIEDFEKQYFWQEKEVYNHILPILEIRASKLQRVRPRMSVMPASADDSDIKTSQLSKKIINSIYNKREMNKIIIEATTWSEICGTSFYKVVWNKNAGNVIAQDEMSDKIKSGEVEITVCSPFEIFPESATCKDINDCRSLIHAKAYHIDDIKQIWGVEVKGEDIDIFSLDNTASSLGGLGYNSSAPKIVGTTRSDYSIVIERYEKPSVNYPNGRLVVVAGDKLLFATELPYMNGPDGERVFPFIRQVSIDNIGSFWGTSIIERLIPLQRAYNAVKNRKHEYLNRLSMGVLTVEDGSVDIDNLEEEGLSPGKILVYRQGASAPRYMSTGSVPSDFMAEEERLLNEFMKISGASEIIANANNYNNLSGTALELLIEQDESRISNSADRIKDAIKNVAQHLLRLYKQFATIPRLTKIVGENGEMEMFYFSGSDISSDDIIFETEAELSESLAQRKSKIMELLNAGLLTDENGKLSQQTKIKVLEMLGVGVWESGTDISALHNKKAQKENLAMLGLNSPSVCEVDNHKLHINQHIKFMLEEEYEKKIHKFPRLENIFLKHIRNHKQFEQLNNSIEEQVQERS